MTEATRVSNAPISALIVLLFVTIAYAETMDRGLWRDRVLFRWDISGYYHYLPSVFIHGDLLDLTYIREGPHPVALPEEINWFGIYPSPATEHWFIKFTYGTALFELPFFLVAHAITSANGLDVPDGYSPPYQLAVALSTIFFVAWGLWILRAFLIRYVSDLGASMALITLAFGTNLYFYSTQNAGMSHGFLFFLFAVVLERTDAWHRRPDNIKLLVIAFCCGLITVIRPVDVLVAIIPLLWNCWPREKAVAKWQMLQDHRKAMLIAVPVFLLPLVPQMLYWHATNGHFFFYSYPGEGFHFAPSNIIDGLFSFRKGWFIYSPLAFFGMIALLVMANRRAWKPILFPVVVFYPIFILVVFSWHQWWYGGGFGARPMVETLPLLTLPIAWVSDRLVDRLRLVWTAMVVVVFLGIGLNMFQQYQYHIGMLHWDQMTRERYWEVFLVKDWEGLTPFPPPVETATEQ